MKAILKTESGFGAFPSFSLVEISTTVSAVSTGDVIFDDSGAYQVDSVVHFSNGSYPVVTKERLADYRGMTSLIGLA